MNAHLEKKKIDLRVGQLTRWLFSPYYNQLFVFKSGSERKNRWMSLLHGYTTQCQLVYLILFLIQDTTMEIN